MNISHIPETRLTVLRIAQGCMKSGRAWDACRNRLSQSRSAANKLLSMLKWALVFFLIALVSGALGFTTIAGASIAIAKVLFFIFLALVIIFVIAAIFIGKKVL
jgi:uncharacterized membrane protein YtjA (UPF0391 family)